MEADMYITREINFYDTCVRGSGVTIFTIESFFFFIYLSSLFFCIFFCSSFDKLSVNRDAKKEKKKTRKYPQRN